MTQNRATYIMLRNTAILLITLIITTSIFQGCRKSQTPINNVVKIETNITSRINKVTFIDNTCIMAGGEQFLTTEVFVSQDAGVNFKKMSFPEAGKAIYGMGVAKDGTIYLSGFDGKLLTSGNLGNDFDFHQIQTYKFHNGIAFTANKSAILISTGAQTSGNVTRLDSNRNILDTAFYKFGLNDIAMPSEHTGYIAAFGTILKTTDGGVNWGHTSVKNDNFQSLSCLNESEVWTVGYMGSVWHTTDGGNTWERLRNGNNLTNKRYYLLDVLFKDKTHGWACGEKGILLYTTDGGNKWTEYESFTDDALRDMAIAPNGDLIVVGDNGGAYRVQL